MTQEMIDVCNRVKHSLQIEQANSRLVLIARCFDHDKRLGVDIRSLRNDKYYYNNYFNQLYDMNYYSLEEFEQKMFKIVKDYEESTATRG